MILPDVPGRKVIDEFYRQFIDSLKVVCNELKVIISIVALYYHVSL